MNGPLRTVSLRRRVVASSLVVVAVVLVLVTALTDVVFTAQTRADLRAELPVRATLAQQLVARKVSLDQVARRVEGSGIRATIVGPDGTVYGAQDVNPPGSPDVVLRRALGGGAQLTLVAGEGPVTAVQRRLLVTMVLIGLGALLVAGLITLAATRVALAPLDAMTRLARSITRGDRGQRLAPTRTGTELGRTAAAFDAMLDELEGAEAAARAAEDRVRRFVADAAHELRTPLAGVQAVAAAAIRPGLEQDERDRMHLLLMRETGRAARLVDELLALARVDAGIELQLTPVDLLELARGEAERVRLLAPDRAITVSGAATVVLGDAARLGQILTNLLDNALRYSPPGSPIGIEVGDGATATVRVADTGPGVPPEERERIFDRLVRLDGARSDDHGGAGLGLAVARGLARAHGGDVTCLEPAAGAGAVFELTLPR